MPPRFQLVLPDFQSCTKKKIPTSIPVTCFGGAHSGTSQASRDTKTTSSAYQQQPTPEECLFVHRNKATCPPISYRDAVSVFRWQQVEERTTSAPWNLELSLTSTTVGRRHARTSRRKGVPQICIGLDFRFSSLPEDGRGSGEAQRRVAEFRDEPEEEGHRSVLTANKYHLRVVLILSGSRWCPFYLMWTCRLLGTGNEKGTTRSQRVHVCVCSVHTRTPSPMHERLTTIFKLGT